MAQIVKNLPVWGDLELQTIPGGNSSPLQHPSTGEPHEPGVPLGFKRHEQTTDTETKGVTGSFSDTPGC